MEQNKGFKLVLFIRFYRNEAGGYHSESSKLPANTEYDFAKIGSVIITDF